MKLSNWFKIAWWSFLLVALSYAIFVRFPSFKEGNATAIDSLVLVIWLALALVPIFREIELLGIKLKQESQVLPKQLEILKKSRKDGTVLTSPKTKEALKKFDSPLLTEQEQILKDEMAKINPATQEEKDDIFYRALASSQIAVTFEKTYFTIFGSQIKTLQHLNESMKSTLNKKEVRKFYEEAKTTNQKFYTTYSFEEWLGYLGASYLIKQKEESIGITVRGKEFLKYIVDQRYTSKKAG